MKKKSLKVTPFRWSTGLHFGFLTGLLFAGIGLFCLFSAGKALGPRTVMADNSGKNTVSTIPKGISIEGKDVSGMTAHEAEAVISDLLKAEGAKDVTLQASDKTITVKASDLGLETVNNDLISKAMHYGKKGNPAERFLNQKALQSGKGKDFKLSYGLKSDTARALLTARSADLSHPAVDNGLSLSNGVFTFVPGTSGSSLNIDPSLEDLETFFDQKWTTGSTSPVTIKLTTEEAKPRGSKEELSQVHDLLGSYTTEYQNSTNGRRINIQRAAALMNGKILYPGDSISFFQTVSPLSAANGYATAAAYSDGEVVNEEGGGVCQVSSTTYNAALLAELAIENRAAHSMPVHYVPLSFDAATAGSSDGTYALKDLEFKNNTSAPVYIEEVATDSALTVNIYGKETRPANRKVSFDNHLVSETPIKNKYKADPSLPAGILQKTKSGSTGYVYQLIKTVTIDNNVESTKVQNKSNYREVDAEYSVGVQSGDPAVTAALQDAVKSQDDTRIMAAIQQYTGVSVRPDTLYQTEQLKALKEVAEDNPDDEKAKKAYEDARNAVSGASQ